MGDAYQRPTRGFKHVPIAYADAFATGHVRIGSYRAYRAMENERGDTLEGLAVEKPSPFIYDSRQGPPTAGQLRALHSSGASSIIGRPNVRVVCIGNTWTQEVPHGYMFCLSSEPDFSFSKKGDAIFEVRALGYFGFLVGCSAPEILGIPEVGKVIYEDREIDTLLFEAPVLDPFRKSSKFSFENEIRIAWQPVLLPKDKQLDYYDLHVPGVVDLLTRIA